MFIVIEGTDASGKTSLVDAIVDKLNPHEVLHQGRPEELTRWWAINEYAVKISHRNIHARDTVSDRWHWGEITYAPLKRPDTDIDGFGLLGASGWRWVELLLASRGVAQFWLYQPLDVITARLAKRGDDFVNGSELETILNNYKRAATEALSLGGILQPADGKDELSKTADLVIKVAAARAERAKTLADYPEYIGDPRPDVLLVGDGRNDPDSPVLPFLPINGNSGDYLMSALPSNLWRSVGIVNAGDLYGHSLVSLWDAIGRPRIVALGRMAEREIRSCGLYVNPYTVLPHPQYVRRFHHHDREEYGEAIRAFSYDNAAEHERYAHWVLP